jgi:hypothetical protein
VASIPYNIGIACGPSGLVVVDLDVPGHGEAGHDAPTGADELARLSAEHGRAFPNGTFTVRTPSAGGSHLYFTAPRTRIRNSAGRIGPLIDIRSAGGYVVAPGSRFGGQTYAVTNSVPPAPLPDWIIELAHRPDPSPAPPGCSGRSWTGDGSAYAEAALHNEATTVAEAPEGTRNDTLNRAAFNLGQLVAVGLLPAAKVITTLTAAAEAAGLPSSEARRTIRNGMSAGTRKPRHQTRRTP